MCNRQQYRYNPKSCKCNPISVSCHEGRSSRGAAGGHPSWETSFAYPRRGLACTSRASTSGTERARAWPSSAESGRALPNDQSSLFSIRASPAERSKAERREAPRRLNPAAGRLQRRGLQRRGLQRRVVACVLSCVLFTWLRVCQPKGFNHLKFRHSGLKSQISSSVAFPCQNRLAWDKMGFPFEISCLDCGLGGGHSIAPKTTRANAASASP